MDIATVIGLVSGFGLVFTAVLLGGSPQIFVNVPSFLIVIGGTVAATLINYPLKDVLGVMATVKNAFIQSQASPTDVIAKLVRFATVARREGILALEGEASEAGDEFLQKSVQLAVDGTAPELIKDILTTEIAFMEDRHSKGQGILLNMGAMAPAFGMIGTLVGLVNMLATLSDPSKIGGAMAVALLTTLYGAIVANIVCIPSAGKLKVYTAAELLRKEIVIEGILSIQSGDNPRVVEQKLKAFIAPSMRDEIGQDKAA